MKEEIDEQDSYAHVDTDTIYLIDRIFKKMLNHSSVTTEGKELIKATLDDLKRFPKLPESSCVISLSNGYHHLQAGYTDYAISITDITSYDSGNGSEHLTSLDYSYDPEGNYTEEGLIDDFENSWEVLLADEDVEITVSEEL